MYYRRDRQGEEQVPLPIEMVYYSPVNSLINLEENSDDKFSKLDTIFQ